MLELELRRDDLLTLITFMIVEEGGVVDEAYVSDRCRAILNTGHLMDHRSLLSLKWLVSFGAPNRVLLIEVDLTGLLLVKA